jgi:hypothetical protein
MKIRDLTDKQIKQLQKAGEKAYKSREKKWGKEGGPPPASRLRYLDAFSDGLKAALEAFPWELATKADSLIKP